MAGFFDLFILDGAPEVSKTAPAGGGSRDKNSNSHEPRVQVVTIPYALVPVATVKFLMGTNKTSGYQYRASHTPGIKKGDVVVVNVWPGTPDSNFVTARVIDVNFYHPEAAEKFRPQIVQIIDQGPLEQHRKDLDKLDELLKHLGTGVHNAKTSANQLKLLSQGVCVQMKKLNEKLASFEKLGKAYVDGVTERQQVMERLTAAVQEAANIATTLQNTPQGDHAAFIRDNLLRMRVELDNAEDTFVKTLVEHVEFFEKSVLGLKRPAI